MWICLPFSLHHPLFQLSPESCSMRKLLGELKVVISLPLLIFNKPCFPLLTMCDKTFSPVHVLVEEGALDFSERYGCAFYLAAGVSRGNLSLYYSWLGYGCLLRMIIAHIKSFMGWSISTDSLCHSTVLSNFWYCSPLRSVLLQIIMLFGFAFRLECEVCLMLIF